MNHQEAGSKFKQSEILYAQGLYEQALQVLKELDAAYPNTKNILYPMALCYAGLGKTEKAGNLCDRLINEFQDGRAKSLRDQLQRSTLQNDGLALDMDLLGDLAQPVKKKAPVQVVQPSKMPLYAGIAGAVALIAIIAILAATGDIIARFRPETVESAFEKIAAAASKTNACSGKIQADAKITQPMAMNVNCFGDFEFTYAGQKPMYRIDATLGVEGPATMSQSLTVVCDGDNAYVETSMMGAATAIKMPAQAAEGKLDPKQLLYELQSAGTVTLLKDEVVDNKPAYVFAITPTGTGPAVPGLPEPGTIQVAVLKESGLPARVSVKDKSGAEMLNASLKEVIVNMPSSSDKFKYTPPPDVPVMNLEDMQKTMPFPMPGMR